jgi:DNA-directed RNA polymerase specialized sigma24 family protein
MQWSVEQIAQRFRMPSLDAARVAISRALKRLSAKFTGKD